MPKSIKKLEDECKKLAATAYHHYSFEVSDDDGFVCISQKRTGKRKEKIVIQYTQIENLVDCIILIKECKDKHKKIKQEIDELKKGK